VGDLPDGRRGAGRGDVAPGRDDAQREQWLATLVAYPALIQRPIIVTDDGAAYIARDEQTLAEVVEQHQGP
jgi:arsenate reductase